MIRSSQPKDALPRRIVIAGVMLIAGLCLSAGYTLWQSYQRTLGDADREISNLTSALGEHTARSFQQIDLILQDTSQWYEELGPAAIDPQVVVDHLSTRINSIPQMRSLSIFDSTGERRYSSRGTSVMPINVANRAFFVDATTQTQQRLFIGEPIRTQLDNQWAFGIARRLTGAEGAFAGVVVSSTEPEYFEHTYSALNLGAGSAVALFRNDGTLLAEYPGDGGLGQRFEFVPEALARTADAAGHVLRMNSPFDAKDSLVSVHAVGGFPLAVVVSRQTDVVMAGWREQATRIVAITLTLSLMAALMIALFIRTLARLTATGASLRVSEDRYAVAMAGSSEGHWDWNLRTGSVFQSPRALELHGLDKDDAASDGSDWAERMPVYAKDRQRLADAIGQHLEGRTDNFEVEYRVRGAGNEYRWVLTRGRCFRDATGKPYRIAGSSSDVSTRKRAEVARQESEQRWQAVFEHSPLGIVISKPDGSDMTGNPTFRRILGYSADELARLSATDLTHPDDRQRATAYLADFKTGARDFLRTEKRYLRKDGGTVWVDLSVVIVAAADGVPAMSVATVEDITDRRNAEMERRQLEAQLRQAQKLEAIGTLAGGIAHDFNNILAAILGYGEMAQEAIRHRETRRYVDNVVNAGQRGKALVERILAFSRTAVVARRPFAVEPIVEETSELLRGSLPSNVQFDLRLAAGDVCVIGDATQMHQIVMNLGTNALAAMHAGGRLAIATETVTLDTRRNLSNGALEPGKYVLLTVEDTGTGMSPETLERIFDPFFTTRPPGSGTGLGLSLVHGIVNDMGGAIDVHTDIGKGTRFVLYFPVVYGANLPLLEDSGDTPRGQGETVMVVDDEPTLVELGEEMLADLGYEPVGFGSAQAALASFRADPGRFDIVITDETMPGMSGTEFACALAECRDDVTVLLVSGYSTPAMVEAAFRAGVHNVLTKPLRKSDLGRAIASALRSRRVVQ